MVHSGWSGWWQRLRRLAGSPRLRLLALATGLLASRRSLAQDSTFVRLLRQHSYPLTLAGTQLTGPGWEHLRQAAHQSQFVLLGEDHGVAQIPVLARALAEVQQPAVFVVELDPYQAQDLSQLASQPGLPRAYTRQHPLGLSFYSWQEEFELARFFRSRQVPILGIDQVGITSTGRFLDKLAQQVRHRPAREALQRQAAAYQAADLAAMRQATNHFVLNTLSDQGLDSLRQLVRTESPDVQQQVQEFAASHEIYTLAKASGLRSHQLRVGAMKRRLLQGLRGYQVPPALALPRLFFKFGAFHMSRGLSLVGGVYDVGNLVANLADAQQAQSLHLLVLGKQGTKLEGFNPDDFSRNEVKYSNLDEAALAPFLRQVPAPGPWQVIDLRPLRQALLSDELKVSSQDVATVLLGYDYVVVIPETTASHNY